MSDFVVHVARLLRSPGARWHEVRVGVFDPAGVLAPASPVDSAVPPGAEATCDVLLDRMEGGIMVTGTVSAPWRGVCGRCTEPVAGTVAVRVRERYVEREPDEEAYPIIDGELDLAPLVHDAVLLELPLAPLCKQDCLGLCPHCGADRNRQTCACVAPRDPRWANLDVLRSPS